MNAQGIKELLEQSQKIYTINNYLNKERFMSYAKVKYPLLSDRNAEALWAIWEMVCSGNVYKLRNVLDNNLEAAWKIAEGVYNSITKGAYVRFDYDYQPMTARWKIYYRHGEEGDMQTMELDLRDKEDAIKYALLLQQENVEILLRVDFYETVTRCDTERTEVPIYNGDIIFCNHTERFCFSDNSGAYVCCGDCYKKLLYTAGRGYLWRDEPNYEQDKHGNENRYNYHVFDGYDKSFRVVGNIYVDRSILVEKEEEDD